MSAGKGRGQSEGQPQDLSDEIEATMAEAEAAVTKLEDEGSGAVPTTSDDDDDGVELIDDEDEVDEGDRLGELEAEVASLKDKWLRAVADHENYKKRVKREIEDAKLRSVQDLLPAFLPVMDNLERALEVAEPAANNASDDNSKNVQNLVQGIRMVAKEFVGALGRHGIEPVEAVGLPFDPSMHDALSQVDSPDHAPGVVVREFEKGYRMKGRLLRPARVIVAGPGSTGEAPADEPEVEEGAEN